ARPKAGIFNRSRLAVAADDHRLKIWEAHVDGASVASLARRFERPIREIYRIITEMRARDLQSRPIEYIPSPDFTRPDAQRICLEDPHLNLPAEPDGDRHAPPNLPPYLRQLFRVPLLTREQEVALFRKLNYLRHCADQARQRLEPAAATAAELDAIENLLDEANAVKNRITQANLRLVVS